MKKSTLIKILSILTILSILIVYTVSAEEVVLSSESKTTGNINNIVVFLKFAGQKNVYNDKYEDIKKLFNNKSGNSLKHYLKTMSYNKLIVNSTFYPLNEDGNIYCCEVSDSVSYYEKLSEVNKNGYSDFDRNYREKNLLIEVLNKIKNQIPNDLNIDHDNDGIVDSIVFIEPEKRNWGEILWPHEDEFGDESLKINGKRLGSYAIVTLDDLVSYGTLAHEYLHILGLNDLYSSPKSNDLIETRKFLSNYDPEQSIINESIMASNSGILTNYERKKLNWISDIKTLTEDGNYTLIPSVLSEEKGNIAYKIPVPNDNSKYFILEYRANGITEYDDKDLQGLFIYGVDENVNGNIDSPPYEVYSMSDFNRETYKDYQSSYIAKNDYGIHGYEEYLKNGFNAFTLNDGSDNLGISISNVSFKNGKVKFKLTLNEENTIETSTNSCESSIAKPEKNEENLNIELEEKSNELSISIYVRRIFYVLIIIFIIIFIALRKKFNLKR